MKLKSLHIILIILFHFGASTQTNSLLTKDCHLPCLNKTYQVAVHMSMDSLGNTAQPSEIENALRYTTNLFAPICVQFQICSIDTLVDYSFDSIPSIEEAEEFRRLMHDNNRINIYVISYLDNDNKGPATVCGFASLGSVNHSTNAFLFYESGCGGETMAHEMGHLFGLLHTFEGGNELVDGSNCQIAGDNICDTPADPYIEETDIIFIDENCEFIYEGKDSNGDFYSPLTGNTMSYMCGGCGFTKGQFLKMVATYESAEQKNW